MIIWLNGAFGVGKTTVARCICEKLLGAFLYDPENVGGFLWDNFPPELSRVGDFQDLTLWRSINYDVLFYLSKSYAGHLVVPMTVTNADYAAQIIGRLREDGVDLRHFILEAPEHIILQRLCKRGEVPGSWPERQLERCQRAFAGAMDGIPIATAERTVEEIAEEILHCCTLA